MVWVTISSGNHGQALAYATSNGSTYYIIHILAFELIINDIYQLKAVANLDCTIVCPKTTPDVKCQAIKDYGAQLVLNEKSLVSR